MSATPYSSWEKWAQRDPYFAVLTSDQFKTGTLDNSSRAEFFETGRRHIEWVLTIAERQFGTIGKGRALDYGCGVGRLVIPLAGTFEHVTGVDISPTMADLARANCASEGRTNTNIVVSNGLDLPTEPLDFCHSVLVFQHIDTAQGMRIIGQLVGALAPGGVFALHVNLARRAGKVTNALYRLRRKIPPVHGVLNALKGRPIDEPIMEMNVYSLNEILLMGFASRIDAVFGVPFHDEPHPGVILFLHKKA